METILRINDQCLLLRDTPNMVAEIVKVLLGAELVECANRDSGRFRRTGKTVDAYAFIVPGSMIEGREE
jgi:hypothetical protein